MVEKFYVNLYEDMDEQEKNQLSIQNISLASTSDRVFLDFSSTNGYYKNANFNNVPAPVSWQGIGKVWPVVTSKNNSPRTEGTNPHRGIDFRIEKVDQPVYPIYDGVVDSYTGSGNTTAIRIKSRINGVDVIFRYCHIVPTSFPIGTAVTAGRTQIGEIKQLVGMGNHLHISIEDSTTKLELPHRYFFKNVSDPRIMNGDNTDLMFKYLDSPDRVFFRAYARVSDNIEPLQYVNITYKIGSGSPVTAQMTHIGNNNYRFAFPQSAMNKTVKYYISAKRSNVSRIAYQPSYYESDIPPESEWYSKYVYPDPNLPQSIPTDELDEDFGNH